MASTSTACCTSMTPVSGDATDHLSADRQFMIKVLSIPSVQDVVNVLCKSYNLTKDRYHQWNVVFVAVEGILTTTLFTTYSIATPVVNRLGGWNSLDVWACKGLEKLEEVAPIIQKPPQEIKQIIAQRIQDMLDFGEDDSFDLSYSTESSSDEDEPFTLDSCQESRIPFADSSITSTDGASRFLITDGIGQNLDESIDLEHGSRMRVQNPVGIRHSSPINEGGHGSSRNDSSVIRGRLPWWRRLFQRRQSSSSSRSIPDSRTGYSSSTMKSVTFKEQVDTESELLKQSDPSLAKPAENKRSGDKTDVSMETINNSRINSSTPLENQTI